MSHTTSTNRQREHTQRDRLTQKEAHRLKQTPEGPKSKGQDDPELAGMVAGPQLLQEYDIQEVVTAGRHRFT